MSKKKGTSVVGETKWWCEKCHASGVIEHDGRDSVYDVLHLLTHVHENHRLAQLESCEFETRRVRVEPING